MPLPSRRRILAASTLLLAGRSRPGQAQQYPSRPITIVVGYPPAGISDTATRLIAQRIGQELAVIAKDIVPCDTADGWFSLDGGVRPEGVVGVQPGMHGLGPPGG